MKTQNPIPKLCALISDDEKMIETERRQFIRTVSDAMAKVIEQNTRTCLNCQYFDEKFEMCRGYNARPPARVIAFGCDKFEDAIPF